MDSSERIKAKNTFETFIALGSSSNKISKITYAHNLIIYVCGATIVFYSPLVDEQLNYIQHNSDQISCICASPNQKYLAVATEGKLCHLASYQLQKVFQAQNSDNQLKPIWDEQSHKKSIDEVLFDPTGKYIVSYSNKDMSLFVVSSKTGQKLTLNKLTNKINKAIFDETIDLITVGKGTLKIWNFLKEGALAKKKQRDTAILEGKTITFSGSKFKSKNYVDVGCYQANILVLSDDGNICMISKKQNKKQKWIQLLMSFTTSLLIYQDLLLCSGQNAIVKIIKLKNWSFQAEFPKPTPNFKQNITLDQKIQYFQSDKFPRCLAIRKFDKFLVTLYSNRTIFLWKPEQKFKAIPAVRSIISHRERISTLCLLQEIAGSITFFASASSDNTIRLWHFSQLNDAKNIRQSVNVAEYFGIKRNAYCRNLTRIIYTQNPVNIIKLFSRQFIICSSREQLQIYSLQKFELIENLCMESQIKAIDVLAETVYVGQQNGLVSVFKYDGELTKIKDIDFQMSLQDFKFTFLQEFDAQILVISGSKKMESPKKGSAKSLIKIYKIQNRLGQYSLVQQNIFHFIIDKEWVMMNKNHQCITFFNLITRSKGKRQQIKFKQQLSDNQQIKTMKNNSKYLCLLTTNNQLLILDFIGSIVLTKKLNQQINDFAITENFELILGTESGSILIQNIIIDSRFNILESKIKSFGQDKKWLEASVWKSQSMKIEKNVQQSKKIQQNINIEANEDDNIKNIRISRIPNIKLPDVNIGYKDQNLRQTVFNPSSIGQQIGKVLHNVASVQREKRKTTQQSQVSEKKERKGIFLNIKQAQKSQQQFLGTPRFQDNNQKIIKFKQSVIQLDDDDEENPRFQNNNQKIIKFKQSIIQLDDDDEENPKQSAVSFKAKQNQDVQPNSYQINARETLIIDNFQIDKSLWKGPAKDIRPNAIKIQQEQQSKYGNKLGNNSTNYLSPRTQPQFIKKSEIINDKLQLAKSFTWKQSSPPSIIQPENIIEPLQKSNPLLSELEKSLSQQQFISSNKASLIRIYRLLDIKIGSPNKKSQVSNEAQWIHTKQSVRKQLENIIKQLS